MIMSLLHMFPQRERSRAHYAPASSSTSLGREGMSRADGRLLRRHLRFAQSIFLFCTIDGCNDYRAEVNLYVQAEIGTRAIQKTRASVFRSLEESDDERAAGRGDHLWIFGAVRELALHGQRGG